MTNSRLASITRPSLKAKTGFIKYLLLLVCTMGVVFTQVNAAITVNSTPQTDNDFCGTGAPSLILPVVATSNCGSGTITYQWYVGSTFATSTAITAAGSPNYSGWNTSTLNVNNASALGTQTTYWAVATESSGACSDADTLGPFNYTKVTAAPTVNLTSSFDVCEGDSAQWTATVTGPSPAGILTYEWYRTPDGSSASLVKTTSDVTVLTDEYGYPTVLTDDQDDIYVDVSNACGTTTSSTSTVTVDPVPDVTVPSSMSTLSACEGNNVNIQYTISNAVRDASSGGGNVNWSISFSGDAALISLLTSSGSGNTGVNLNVGAALSPGVYNATISTITNTDDGCPRTISTNAINVTIYPEPTITFSATPSNICNGSGSGTSFEITVANAEYNNGGGTVAVNWQATVTELSFTEVTSCIGGSAGLLSATISGSGNGTFTYNIPTTMGVGIYQYTLTGITNTSNGCTGAVTGTSVVEWRVDPTPNIAVIPASNSVCEGGTQNFNLNVTNAEYCGTTFGSGTHSDVDWSLTYTDATNSTIGASPLVGSGEGAQGPFTTSAALTPGTYTFDPGTITVTAPAAPGCARTIVGNTYTLTVNPEPSVTFSTASITQCEGTSGTTFSVDVTNAELNSVGQNWSVNYSETGASALTSTPCTAGSSAGIITGSLTGTGNGSTTFTIPATLAPGYYTYTLNSITNTSAGCSAGAGSVGANPTITIIIEAAPIITMNPNTKDVCEGDAESFNLSITNTTGCSGIGSSTTADWTLTGVTDNVDSDVTTQIPGGTGTGDQTYTIGANGSGTLTPNDHSFIASVYNSTGGSSCGISNATADTFILSVDPRPDVQINGVAGAVQVDVCQGTSSSFSFVVTNAEHNSVGVPWEITYSETSGQVVTSCNGAVTVDLPGASGSYQDTGSGTFTVTIPASLPVGQYTYTVSNIVNTDGPCTGTVDGVTLGTQTVTINVYPRPSFTVQPDSGEVCENNIAFNAFALVVTNAQYCSTPSTLSNASWEISGITDNVVSNAPSPITGSGNGATSTYNANTGATLAAGSYTYEATSITTTGLSTNCSQTISANNTFVLTVNPAPDASFTSSTVSVCEGSTGTVSVAVSNAMLNGNPVNWSFDVSETSGNLNSACNVDANENADLVRDTTGSGNNATITYNIPDNLTPGVYTYTISNVLNTDESCTGTSATSTVTIYVYPRLEVAVSPSSDQVCEGETADFDIDVTNARYCTALNTASTNVPWTLSYSDATQSNIFPDPLTGSGNSSYTFTANNGGLLTAGQYQFITSTITGQIVTPTAANCPVSVPDTFTLTVNPEPEVTWNTTTMTLCQGDTGTFSYIVSNAELLGSGVDWSVSITSEDGVVSNSCASGGTNTFTETGNGDSTVFVGVPTNLEPGVYTFTLNGITNTSHTCTGSVGAIATITITVYPLPDIDFSTDSLTVCENTTGSFDVTITNAQYCASVGGSLIDVSWEVTHTDGVQSTMPASVWAGTGNMSATSYTVNSALGLTAGGSPYTLDVSQIENVTHSCVNTDSFTGTELVVIVNDLPVLTIDDVETDVCDSSTAFIVYSVSDVEATDGWSFTYSTDGGTTNTTVTGTGPASGDTVYTVILTPPSIKTLSFTAITNTTTTCVGNTPSSVNINVLTLPDVTSFADASGTNICSGLTNDYDLTVANSAGKSWVINYTIGGVAATWTGTGNGAFTRTIPTQYWADSAGAFDNRPLIIQSIAWTGGAGTPPLCENNYVTDSTADLNVMPRPHIGLIAPTNVCVNYTADIIYHLNGVRSTDVWEFDWYTTNPNDGPNNITSNGQTIDSFTTQPLYPVGSSNVWVPTVTNNTTGCDSSYSAYPWADTITVDPPTVPGTLSPSYTICDGDSGPYVFNLTGYTGDVQYWDSSDNDGFTWYNLANTTDSHTVVYPHLTTRYHVVVKSGACPADTSNEVILFVHPQPAANIVSVNDSICEGSNIDVVYAVTGVPNTHGYSVDYTVTNGSTTITGTWTGTGSSSTNSETLTNGGSGFSAGTWSVILTGITNTNTGCDTVLADTATVLVKSNPVGSTASTSNDTLCYQSNGFVRWDGSSTDGYVVKWQKKLPSASTWTDISGSAADSIEFTALAQTTMFRAVIENAPCTGQATSTPVTIVVLSTDPSASFVNLPASRRYCASATNTVTVNYGVTGTNGYDWTLTLLEEDSTHVITGTGDDTLSFTTTAGTMLESFEITLVKLVISSGTFSCTKNLDNTGIANFTIIDLPTVTLNSVTDEVCDGDSVTMSFTVGQIKASESWEMDYTINSVSMTTTGTGPGTFTLKIPYAVSGGNSTQTVELVNIENTTTQTSASANCVNTLSGVTETYEVRGATVAGVIGTSTEVCKGASGSVTQTTASTNGGVIIDWLSRTYNGSTWTGWSSTGNTTTTQSYVNIQNSTEYMAVYQNSPCDTAGSNIVRITVRELPTASISLSGSNDTICQGATATIDLVVGNVDNGQTFTIFYVEGSTTKSASFTNNATNTHTFTTGALSSTTDITLTGINTTSGVTCSNTSLNSTVTVTVQDNPLATIASYDSRLCHGSTVDFTVTVSNVATTDNWTLVYTLDGNTETVTGTGAGTFSFTTTNTVTSTSDVLALVSITNNSTQDACASSLSGSVTISVDPTTVAGVIAEASDTICKGSNTTISETTAGTGSIIGWEFKTTGASNWTGINNTNTTLSVINLQQTTQYRAIYQSGLCDTAQSNIVTITVNELPVGTLSISAGNDTICQGETTTIDLTVSNIEDGQTFTIYYVEGSTSKSKSFTNNSTNTHTFTTGTISSNTDITLTRIETTSRTMCSNTNLNTTVTVTVQDNPNATITSYDSRLCHGENVQFTVNVSNVATADDWSLVYTLDGNTETVTGTGSGSFTFTTSNTVTSTSDVLALVSITNTSTQDSCVKSLSGSVTITVDPTTVAGVIGTAAISSDTIVCRGGSGFVTEYTSGTGNIVKWQSRKNGSSTWVDINSTATTQFFFNLQDTIDYRAVYESGVCSQEISNVVTATPKELPVAVITTVVDDSICAGTTADFEVTVTNVDVGSTFQLKYSEGSVPKTSSVLTQTASGVHTLTTSALTSTTLIQLTSIEVLSTPSNSIPACSNTLSSNGTVTVLDLPFASITAGPDTLCQLDEIVFTVTVTNVLATDNWVLRYELESDEDTITGTGPGSVTWVDTDSNTAESAKIQLIEILNVSNLGICKSVNTDDWDIYIYKPTEPGEIAASVDTICKGGNTTISEVTGTPKQGVTVSWEYKPISAANWTALSNNNTTLNVLNLQETTDYRAVYKSGVCDTAHSNVVRIQVEELPLATISGSTTICEGDSTDLTVVVSNVGTGQDWEIDYLVGTLFDQFDGTGPGSHTLRVGNFITNSDVVLRQIATVSGTPQCLNDKLTNNAKARVNVNPRPYASLNSVVSPICHGNTSSFSFTVSNVKSGDNWTLTYEVDDATGGSATTSGQGPGTYTISTPVLTDAKTYVVNLINILNTTTGCDSALTASMNIVADSTTDPGMVVADTTVCSGAHVGTVRHSGGNGSIIRWEISQDGGSTWSSISNTASTYTYTNLTTTSMFRVVKQNGVCDEAATSPITVTVNELPVATISGSDTICAGESANLTVTVTNAQGEDWAVSYLRGTVLDTLMVSGPATTGTINTGTIKTTTDITLKKVWMTSGSPQCENDDLNNNATATIEVDDVPNARLIVLTDTVCTGNPADGKITVSDVRSSESWKVYWSINGGSADSVSGTGSGSFNFQTANLTVNPSTLRLTNMINTTTGCTATLTDSDVVVVSPQTVGGTLSGTDTVCKGTNSGTLTLSSHVGDILSWEYSTNGGTTWTTINNTAATYMFSNLTQTTMYRVLVQSGVCDTEYSSVVTIKVNELPLAEMVSVGMNSICEGSSTFVALNITNVGAGMNWTLTYLQGSSVKTLMGTGPGADTIWTGTLTTTTDITLQSIEITSGYPQCENNNFNNKYTTTITVIDNPTATITNYPKDICVGETPTVTVLVDDVLSSEAWTLIYRVNGGSNITSTGVGSGQFNLANMPQFNTEGPNGVRLISITNTSTNPNCTSALTDSITINVDSTSVGGTIAGPSRVCSGDHGTLSLSGYRGDILKWQYSTDGINYYDIANTSDSLVFTNLTTKTWYRAMVMNGVCDSDLSSVFTVDVQELPTVTINNPSIDICAGETATLNLTIGNVTSTSTWSVTYEENGTASSYTSGTGTTESITFGPYTQTTTIEFTGIVVTNGLGCSDSISEKAVVTVTPNPTATINSVPDSLCEGDILVYKVTVDDVSATTRWELDYEVDGSAGPTKRGTGPGTFTVNTGRSVSPSSVKLKLTEIALDNSLGCFTTLNDSAEIKVSPTTVGGTLSPASTTICQGDGATLTLSGHTGYVQNWEYSTNGGTTWTVLSNTDNSITVNNITETTMYRVYVKSGTCKGAYSSTATVTVIPTPEATVTSNDVVCPGDDATFTLHVTNVPAGQGWSVVYTRNGTTVGTPVTGTGSGDFNFAVTGASYSGNPTLITVELVSIENTTHNCVNNNLNSKATARVTPNPVARFTADSHCEDSTVDFNNTSTIAEGAITTYKWYFGDGDSSVNASPSHVYTTAGTYNVRLIVWSDNGCRGEVTQSITIHPNPVADFTFSNVCKNENFTATDRSTVSSGNIVSWFWTFGDGSTSTDQNPTHAYAASGNYDVTLTVVTDNGCSNTVSKEVTVYILPEANFVASPVCENNAMQFINTSAIGYGTMTYEWDFDNGNGTSTDKDPSFTFNGFGTFRVEMIATSNNGCKDTIVRNVTVHPVPTADFSVADVCIGEASVFVNNSAIPAPDTMVEYFWDFGDATFSGLENPTHTYATDGDFNVTLRVKSNNGCENTITKVASVIPLPEVGLRAGGPTEFCDGDSVILRTNDARTYEWTWVGGTSSDSTIYAKTEGWYKVRITAPPIGCANEDSIFITVYPLPDAQAWPRNKVTQSRDTISRGQSIDLHASGGVNYTWDPSTYLDINNAPDVNALRMEESTLYTVTVTDINGCTKDTTVEVIVLNNFDLIVYNAVTPNGDGKNDTWIIENIWAYPDAEVIIFNRYGMEVFRGTNYQNDWDAMYNGKELPDGAYYYVILHPDFPDLVYKGALNVIRETK